MNDFDNVTGLVGSRAIVYFAGRMYSPVYGHCEWPSGYPIMQANCAIGCVDVPSDRHLGCGFHAHFEPIETQRFVEQIRGTADCVTLVECFGRIVTHEKGFRAQQARIIAVLDWNPHFMFFTIPVGIAGPRANVPTLAQKYFGVPMIDVDTAERLIERQRARLLGTDPNISYQPRGQ